MVFFNHHLLKKVVTFVSPGPSNSTKLLGYVAFGVSLLSRNSSNKTQEESLHLMRKPILVFTSGGSRGGGNLLAPVAITKCCATLFGKYPTPPWPMCDQSIQFPTCFWNETCSVPIHQSLCPSNIYFYTENRTTGIHVYVLHGPLVIVFFFFFGGGGQVLRQFLFIHVWNDR